MLPVTLAPHDDADQRRLRLRHYESLSLASLSHEACLPEPGCQAASRHVITKCASLALQRRRASESDMATPIPVNRCTFRLEEAAAAVRGTLFGSPDATVTGVATDTRSL